MVTTDHQPSSSRQQHSQSTNSVSAVTSQPDRPLENGPRPRGPNSLPFRIVWGTKSNCNSQVVHKAVCSILSNTLWGLITVVRSVRHRDGRPMWWYTIMAPAGVMEDITRVWHILEAKTSWSLIQSLSSRRRPNHPPGLSSVNELHTTLPPSSESTFLPSCIHCGALSIHLQYTSSTYPPPSPLHVLPPTILTYHS